MDSRHVRRQNFPEFGDNQISHYRDSRANQRCPDSIDNKLQRYLDSKDKERPDSRLQHCPDSRLQQGPDYRGPNLTSKPSESPGASPQLQPPGKFYWSNYKVSRK